MPRPKGSTNRPKDQTQVVNIEKQISDIDKQIADTKDQIVKQKTKLKELESKKASLERELEEQQKANFFKYLNQQGISISAAQDIIAGHLNTANHSAQDETNVEQ